MLGGWLPGLFDCGRQRSRHKDLFAELILRPDEAARGGLFALELPVLTPCGQCSDSGLCGMLYCPRCGGRTHERRRVDLSVPRGVCDGQRARVSLEDIGGPRVNLSVLVTVTAS